jgi:hypothetical protein
MNRKFSYFIDLRKMEEYQFSESYSKEIYFLEEQRRVVPLFDLGLKEQLERQI